MSHKVTLSTEEIELIQQAFVLLSQNQNFNFDAFFEEDYKKKMNTLSKKLWEALIPREDI